MPASIGGNASKQRSYSSPPETGTMTTSAVAAWAGTTAYVVDPTSGGTNTVTNVGNLYQCISPGTSAASGGPTTTAADITDGTCHWKYLGPNPSQNTSAGSQVLAVVARGTQSTAASVAPSDNDTGGTATTISNTNYSGYADSYLGVFRRPSATNVKTGYAASAAWGGTSVGSGTGDELTLMWIELVNVSVGAPHTYVQVERTNGTAGIVTGASFTISKPCLHVSVWGGNGAVLSAGTTHTAIPLGGLTAIPGCDRSVSLSTNGYIQVKVAWRLISPGTYTSQWQTGSGTSEGAQIIDVLYEDTSTIAGDDEPPRVVWLQPGPPARAPMATADELPVAPSMVADDPAPAARVPWTLVTALTQGAADELALITVTDYPGPGRTPPVPTWAPPPMVAGVDEMAAIQVADDDVAASWPAQPAPLVAAPSAQVDDLPVAAVATIMGDDDTQAAALPWLVAIGPVVPVAALDELPVAVVPAALDDATGQPVGPAAWRFGGVVVLPPADDLPIAAAPLDDPGAIAPAVAWMLVAASAGPTAADDWAPTSALVAGVLDDDSGAPVPAWWPAILSVSMPIAPEELPGSALVVTPRWYSMPTLSGAYDGPTATGIYDAPIP